MDYDLGTLYCSGLIVVWLDLCTFGESTTPCLINVCFLKIVLIVGNDIS